jgi:hypothetical protein
MLISLDLMVDEWAGLGGIFVCLLTSPLTYLSEHREITTGRKTIRGCLVRSRDEI